MEVEGEIRRAIRDAVNRPSRKPFHWGGLAGYQQLAAIGGALSQVRQEAETTYLHRLASQVNRAVETNRTLAHDLAQAHTWVRQIADCLRYPWPPSAEARPQHCPLSSEHVRDEMNALRQQFQPDLKRQPAQAALYQAWHRLWKTWQPDLLHCYDIPGLPADNLDLEARFGQLRRHQRRISGCQSTRPLRDFGQYQVLFAADSEEDLLHHLRQVPLADYQAHRRRLAEAEAPRLQLYRLHRDPVATMRALVDQHAARREALGLNDKTKSPP